MSGILPNGKQQFIDSNGNPLASGKVYYYIPSTTTFKNTWQDPALTILNTNPIQLDANGQCIAYGEGSYRQQVYDVNNNLIWDQESDSPISISDVEAIYSAPNGSSLIGYNEGSTGASNRTVQAKLKEIISVKDFGAIGNGIADDTAAIQAAINYVESINGGTIYFPAGTYNISSGFTITTTSINFVGQGNGWSQVNSLAATNITTIKAIASMSYMIKFNNINNGACGIQGILLDGSSSLYPNIALILDGVTGGYFQNVGILNAYNVGVQLLGTTNTCSWNTFVNLSCNQLQGIAALWVSGFTGQANSCHNTFITTRLAFGGAAHGVLLGGCDNNTFHMTFIYASGTPSGYGVYCDPTENSGFPGNNTFYHLEASTQGWFSPSGQIGVNTIHDYMTDNGEPIPNTSGQKVLNYTLQNGGICGTGGFFIGGSFGSNFNGFFAPTPGVTSYTVTFSTAEPNTNYIVFLSFVNAQPPAYYVTTATTGFTIYFASATPSGLNAGYLITRL